MRPRLVAISAGVRLAAIVAGTLVMAAVGPAASSAAAQTPERASIVVTTDVLGGIVRELVGDAADITVLMPGGADPHGWAPSARDTEALLGADLVVANGLGLEEGLADVLDSAATEGVPIFEATDHVSVRDLAAGGEEHADEPAGHADGHGSADPHFWLDPLAMRDVVLALAPALAGLGVDVDERGTDLPDRLVALDAEVAGVLASIPAERRRLVTGHESLGYFAARYGFELVGTVVPGLSSQGEPSARDLDELAKAVREAGIEVVFAEVGTSHQVAAALAGETGARVVELALEQLPPDGSYESLIRGVATTIADALGG